MLGFRTWCLAGAACKQCWGLRSVQLRHDARQVTAHPTAGKTQIQRVPKMCLCACNRCMGPTEPQPACACAAELGFEECGTSVEYVADDALAGSKPYITQPKPLPQVQECTGIVGRGVGG